MKKRKANERPPDDIDPITLGSPLQHHGHRTSIEERVNFGAARYRPPRTRRPLRTRPSRCFASPHNIRYITSTVIGEWSLDRSGYAA